MKNVSWVKTLFLTTLVICSLFSCVSLSWATDNNDDIEVSFENLIRWCLTPDVVNTGEDELVEAMQYAQSVWRKSLDVRKKVDYSVLTSIYSRLLSQGVPCEIVTSRGAAQGYYIKGTGDLPLCNGKGRYSIKGSYFSDTSGNIFYADLPDNGKTSSSVPSTSAPTVSENTNTTYVRGPSSDLSVLTPSNELQALKYINQTAIHIANETHRIIELLGDTEKYVFRLYLNVGRVIDGLNSIISGVYRQADLLAGYLPRLDDTVNRLTDIRSASWASVDVENRILSSSTRIGSLLSSVVQNGQLQVNTSPLEARLDKLISMYSKVNSVVLDTASVNGGQITGAVGGELQDVIFWGDTGKYNNEFLMPDSLLYRLGPNVGNTTLTTLDDSIVLRSVPVSASFDGDSVVSAGIWQKGSSHILSDTYNATTGVYIQRVGIIDLGSLSYIYLPYPFNSNFSLYHTQTGLLSMRQDIGGGDFLCSGLTNFASYPASDDNPNKSITSNHNGYLYIRYDEAANSTELLDYVSGMQLLYPLAVPIIQQFDPSTIAIPEGNSYISSDNVRITGKYETYDSYTQTADIISGIGRTEALLSSINTAVQNIKSYTSSVKTTTSTISTNVGKVNTALTSVIADGLLKVDNSAVVAAIEGIQPGSAADLSPVVTRMDAILAELQNTSGSAACEHTYTQHTEQEATCPLPGLLIFTCSQCGDSYSEIVDPLGHDWIVTSHVDAVTDPDTGEETVSAYDVYTCSRCQRTYEDHDGSGPEEDYSSSSISKLVVKVFSRLGTFAGKLIGSVIHLFDKAITALDNVVSKFNEYVEQISGFGGGYPAWLTGFWGVLPAELQVALTFAVICMALGVVGKKLFFS